MCKYSLPRTSQESGRQQNFTFNGISQIVKNREGSLSPSRSFLSRPRRPRACEIQRGDCSISSREWRATKNTSEGTRSHVRGPTSIRIKTSKPPTHVELHHTGKNDPSHNASAGSEEGTIGGGIPCCADLEGGRD